MRLNLAQEDKDSFSRRRDQQAHPAGPLRQLGDHRHPELAGAIRAQRARSHRDRGIPGVDGRPADVPIESVYSDTRRDFIDDVAQSTRSRFTWDINDQWQLRQQLGTPPSTASSTTPMSPASRATRPAPRWQQDLKASSLTSNTEAEGQLQTGPIAHRLLVGLEQGWRGSHPKLYQNASPIPAGNLYDPGSCPPTTAP